MPLACSSLALTRPRARTDADPMEFATDVPTATFPAWRKAA